MAVPDKHVYAVIVAGRDHINVRVIADTGLQDAIQVKCTIAFGGDPLSVHLAEHTKKIHQRQVNLMGGECSQPGEDRLTGECETPS